MKKEKKNNLWTWRRKVDTIDDYGERTQLSQELMYDFTILILLKSMFKSCPCEKLSDAGSLKSAAFSQLQMPRTQYL